MCNIDKLPVEEQDKIRRNLSSFFYWLEDENYIYKSPFRRIHKIITTISVKDIYADEDLEKLRDDCKELRNFAIIDILFKKYLNKIVDTTLRYAQVKQSNVKSAHENILVKICVNSVVTNGKRGYMADEIRFSSGILSIIETSRNNALKKVNEELINMYWNVGKYLHEASKDAEYELPYEGAKEMLLVDDVDNKDFLIELFNSMYEELPAPKVK